MKYILFIGNVVGYEALQTMIGLKNCNLIHIFIEQEHSHEYEKYYNKSIEKCESNNIKYTLNAKDNKIIEMFKSAAAKQFDYIMSFGYRRIIPEQIRKFAKIACIGTHFSPLPRYRGFAPLNWLLINGETQTAVNLFYLEDEVDSGDIIGREFVAIDYNDDINSLLNKCILALKNLIIRKIPELERGIFLSEKQDASKATYTCARNPKDGIVNWNWSSRRIYNLVRALTYPYPGAYTYLDNTKIVLWTCEEYEVPKFEGGIPGKVIKIIKDLGIVVLCGEGAILLKDIQFENGEVKTADKYITSIRVTLD